MSEARKPELLTPQNSQAIFIDHQPQMAFGVQSIDRQVLKNNVVARLMSALGRRGNRDRQPLKTGCREVRNALPAKCSPFLYKIFRSL